MLIKTLNVSSIRTKLLLMSLSIVVVAVVCTAYFSIRATVGPLRGVVNESMKALVDEFYTFVEANPDMDWAVIKDMCNEQITIGKTGFIFVMDPEGNMLIHKDVEGQNWGNKAHIKEILEKKNGNLRYLSPETDTYELAAFRFFEEWNWIIVARAFEDDFLAEPRSSIIKYNSIAGLIIVLLAAVIIFLYAMQMTKPILLVVAGLRDIAEGEGDLTRRLEVRSKDEVGDLAKWFNLFLEKIQGIIANIAENAVTLNKSSTGLSELSKRMSTSTDTMSSKANMVASAAEEMSSNISSVASSMEQASTNVGAVATSAEEMTATINEIAQNSEKARTISGDAVSQSKRASERVDELGKAANEIGKVTETITEISEQTNLLALNATIEAARAGEAGKGFGVVANEIKELARQTAQATEEIKNEIDGIQSSTSDTVTEIGQISQVINDVNEIVSTIAAAVEEQSVTTKEIANNVAQASQGIQEATENVSQTSTGAGEIAKDISDVNQSAGEVSNGTSQMNLSVEELSNLASQLKEMVGKFKV